MASNHMCNFDRTLMFSCFILLTAANRQTLNFSDGVCCTVLLETWNNRYRTGQVFS